MGTGDCLARARMGWLRVRDWAMVQFVFFREKVSVAAAKREISVVFVSLEVGVVAWWLVGWEGGGGRGDEGGVG